MLLNQDKILFLFYEKKKKNGGRQFRAYVVLLHILIPTFLFTIPCPASILRFPSWAKMIAGIPIITTS